MGSFLIRRLLIMIPTILIISILAFIVIELPPGDYITSYIEQMEASGGVNEDSIKALEDRFHLNEPWHFRYFKWMSGLLQGDLGYSLAWRRSVNEVLGERIVFSIIVSLSSLLFTWVIAIPIGIYSAIRQYSIGDYIFTFIGFLGLSIPNFMLALILMYLSHRYLNIGIGGLFSDKYLTAPWSWPKLVDFLKHLIVPMIVIGTAGTAGLIRIMRANLLDELRKEYVTTARVKGLKEWILLIKYPIRQAVNPIISTVGWLLPRLISGATITAVVLGLPTAGPIFLQALQQQDMYLAGSFLILTSILTVIGTLISDILLAIIDPRIRYE